MKTSLKYISIKRLAPLLFIVIGVWAFLFYRLIIDEVFDNIDDGLKNQKIEIIREAFVHPEIVNTNEYGLNQFKIEKVDANDYHEENSLTTEMVFMPYDGEEEPYRVLKTGFKGKDHKYYNLEIRTSMMEEDDMMYNLGLAILFLYLFLMISILLLYHFVMGKILEPFYKILSQIKAYRLGTNKYVEPINTSIKEFDRLEKEFGKMILRNEDVFIQQKVFIENASHELQTPLTVTINQLDLILESSDLPEQDYLKISKAKDALWRMVQLNKSLLLLSRIDNKQFTMNDSINFNELILEWIDDMTDWMTDQHIQLEIEQQGVFTINFHKDLAKILFSNLMRNAITYNDASKIVKVQITNTAITVKNKGVATPLNKKLIFERFYKSGSSNTSNGLGLSIVKSIINLQPQLELDYEYSDELHQFIIKKKPL